MASQAILTGLFVSLMIGIPGCLGARKLLQLMGATAEMRDTLWGYTALMLGGNGVIMLLFIINAIFRSAGDAALSMRVLWLANLLNIVLDPILIFGWGPFPEMGITGAAAATNIGRGLAVVYQLCILFGGKARVRLVWRDLRSHFATIRALLKIAVGGISQQIIATSSWVGLMRIVSVFGEATVAGYTVAIRIVIFALLPAWGISNATATLVGQNLGAQQPERAQASVWITLKFNILFMGLISIILIVFPGWLIQLLNDDKVVILSGIPALRIMGYGFVTYGIAMVMVQALNGAGDTVTPTKINLLCFWLIEIPLAYALAISFKMSESGVFYAIVIAETILAFCALAVFKQGRWKLKKV